MTPKRRGVVLGAVLAVLISVSGCGEQKPEISSVAAKVLSADVDAVTAAARAGDAAKLQQALRNLRVHVEEQQNAGQLSPARASTILAAGARVALDVGIPPPKVIVSPVPVRVPVEQKKKDKDGDEHEDEEKDEDREEDEEREKDDD